MSWRRGSFCYEGNCAEAQLLPNDTMVAFRNSDVPEVMTVHSRREWTNFVLAVKAGEFDDLCLGLDA